MRLCLTLLALLPLVAFPQEEEEAHALRRIADFWQEGEYPIAKSQMEEFLKNHPQSTFADLLSATLGDLHLREKNYSDALQSYARVQDAEWVGRVFFSRMHCLYEMQWYSTLADECEAYLQKETASEKLQATYFLAISLYHQCLNATKEPETLQKLALRAQPFFETLLQSELSGEVSQAFAHLCCILKEFPKAAHIYEELARQDPVNQEEMLFQAGLIQAEYDKNMAVQTFAKIHELGQKRSKEAAFNRLILLHDLGRHEELSQVRSQVLSEIPADKQATAHLFLGKSLLAINQYAEATKELFLFIQESPTEAGLSALVEAASLGGDLAALDLAIAKWRELFPQNLQLPKTLFARAHVLKKADRRIEARSELEKLLQEFAQFNERAEVLFELAHLEHQDQLWGECRSGAERFLTEFPSHHLAPFAARYLLSASAHLSDKKQFISDIQKWGEFKTFSETEKCSWQFFLSKAEFDLGNIAASKQHLEPLVAQAFPEKNDALLLLALCHKDEPSFCKMAEEALSQGISLMEPAQVHILLFNAYLAEHALDAASAHLYSAFEAKAAIQPANLLWLAERYQQQLEVKSDLFLAKRTATLLERVLQEEGPSETVACGLAKSYLTLSRPQDAKTILEGIADNKEAKRLLAESYLRTGQEEKGEELLDEILKNSANVRNPTSAAACLQSARLKLMRQRDKALAQLKDLVLQKTLSNEPIHLEAALDYVEAHPDKKLPLLRKIKSDFERQDDLLSKDYHAARREMPHKDRIYQAYLLWMESEIARLEAQLTQETETQKELQAKSKHLLLQIMEKEAPQALLERLCREGFNNREMPRRRPDFELGEAGAEAAQPERLGDAGESQKRCLSDAGKTDF